MLHLIDGRKLNRKVSERLQFDGCWTVFTFNKRKPHTAFMVSLYLLKLSRL